MPVIKHLMHAAKHGRVKGRVLTLGRLSLYCRKPGEKTAFDRQAASCGLSMRRAETEEIQELNPAFLYYEVRKPAQAVTPERALQSDYVRRWEKADSNIATGTFTGGHNA